MENFTIETEDSFASLLEYAANNNSEAFEKWIDREPSSIDKVGLWYVRVPGSKQLVVEQRTPLMMAATYGSIDVVKLILSFSGSDVNRSCGNSKSTALHCAASGGSDNAVEIVNLLLAAGADPKVSDWNGRFPVDVIAVSPKSPDLKVFLQQILALNGSVRNESPKDTKFDDTPVLYGSEKKEFLVDPNFPDIKNSIYGTDEFRMYLFKVRPCSRAYSHDWTECPFAHPGENARRRDPRKFHYSCVPCPEFRKGACRRGNMCQYAHGVFESWLHPAQYRTRICKDGIDCGRRVCFFAHTTEELRPLYVSTGSALPSPKSHYSSAMDFVMSPPPMSPSGNGSPSQMFWSPNIPVLNLPGSNFQSNRLRSSFNERDLEDFSMMGESDGQHGRYGTKSLERLGHLKTTMLNLEDLFAADSLSPHYVDSPTQQQRQGMLSPKDTNISANHRSYGIPFSGWVSPHSVNRLEPISPMNSRVSMLSNREKLRSISFREPVNSPISSNWGSLRGNLDWALGSEELDNLRRSSSFDMRNSKEFPDPIWANSSLLDATPEIKDILGSSPEGFNSTSLMTSDSIDRPHTNLGALLEQMQLDELMGSIK